MLIRSNKTYNFKKASMAIEYAFLIIILVAATAWVLFYFKGAICGRWKDSVESTFGHAQYEPGKTMIIGGE